MNVAGLLGSAAVSFGLLFATVGGAQADPGDPIDRIPTPVPTATATPTAKTAHNSRVFAEDALSLEAMRKSLAVPLPQSMPASVENRTSVDLIEHWTSPQWGMTLSGRVNLTEESTFSFPASQTVRSDLREWFAGAGVGSRSYVDVGRMNLRTGVAFGFSPLDFFKTRTSVDESSLDPSVIRNDRLGIVGASYEHLSDGGAFKTFYAPRLSPPSPLSFVPSSGLNPRLDETNNENRFEVSISRKAADFEPQAVLYIDSSQLRYGIDVSHGVGQSLILYGELAGGSQADLIARALQYGVWTRTFPISANSPLPNDDAARFNADVVAGATWTSSKNITLTVEYDYHQAGLTRTDWNNWLSVGVTRPYLRNELWYIRGYANAQEEPLVQQQAFIRIDKPDAFIPHLDLNGIAFINLYDASSLAQLAANYDFSDRWSLGLSINANIGGWSSEHGTQLQASGVTVQARRYF